MLYLEVCVEDPPTLLYFLIDENQNAHLKIFDSVALFTTDGTRRN